MVESYISALNYALCVGAGREACNSSLPASFTIDAGRHKAIESTARTQVANTGAQANLISAKYDLLFAVDGFNRTIGEEIIK